MPTEHANVSFVETLKLCQHAALTPLASTGTLYHSCGATVAGPVDMSKASDLGLESSGEWVQFAILDFIDQTTLGG